MVSGIHRKILLRGREREREERGEEGKRMEKRGEREGRWGRKRERKGRRGTERGRKQSEGEEKKTQEEQESVDCSFLELQVVHSVYHIDCFQIHI